MSELLTTLLVIALLAFLVYEMVTWYFGAKNPPPAYEDEDPVLGKIARVNQKFSRARTSSIATGVVELNGTTWEAETNHVETEFDIGDRCRVSARDGIRLVVEPEA